MRRAAESNINTQEYWDACYKQELEQGKKRLDGRRLTEICRWVMVREGELQRSAHVLDVGCGLGEVPFELLECDSARRVVGIDLSQSAVDHASSLLTSEHVLFVCGSAEDLPFGSEFFDVVWIGETLEHCNDPERVIAEAGRVCVEHGFVIISTPYRGRNRSPEHVWEFEPKDVCRWAAVVGELVFLDCRLLAGWETMFAVMRRSVRVDPS